MARPEIWWVSLHHLHKPSRIVGVFSKQASQSSQLTLWWLHDFRKFRRMTSFSQENFRRKIHLDAPSPGLISLTWRSVVIPVIPYIESDLLGELQLWVRLLRTKGSQLLKQKHHRRRRHPQPSTTKTPRRTKESEMLLQEPSQSLVSTWGCKNMCTIIPWHISLVVTSSENFIQFTNYTVFHLWPILLIWNLWESWLELKCMSKCHWNDEFGAQKSSLMLLFVKALYDAHSLVDGCDKDGDAGVVVASSPGALQCRNRLTSRLRCWTKIQLTVWHVFCPYICRVLCIFQLVVYCLVYWQYPTVPMATISHRKKPRLRGKTVLQNVSTPKRWKLEMKNC